MKYVLNHCFGGFGLSDEAFEWLIKEKNWKVGKEGAETQIGKFDRQSFGSNYYLTPSSHDLEFRSNPDLVECVETLGEKANGFAADLGITECPYGPDDDIEIDEYDGQESLQSIPERW